MMDWSNFIEGYVTGINVAEQEKCINVSLRDKSGRNFTLTLSGVDRFFAHEMRDRNIIDRVNIWDKGSKEDEFRETLTVLITGKMDGDFDKNFLPLIDSEIAAIHQGEKILLEIEPVFGVYIIALCKGIASA
jgi:hypothetical protein